MMKKYDSYKGSGIDWIGDIPGSWGLKRMKFSVNKRDDSVANSSFLIAVENIESGTGKLVGLKKEQRFEGAITGFRKGDVIFNKLRPYLAKVYHAEQDGGCYGELLILRGNESIDNAYLFYLTFSKPFIDTVDSSTHGTKMPRANWDNFIKQLHIPLPSLEEQTQIANYLDTKTILIDDLISKKERLIELLKEERISIINQAVTKGLDPNVKMKDSGIDWLGEIPEHWEVLRMKNLGRVNQGLQISIENRLLEPTADSLPYITIQNINSPNATQYYVEGAISSVICNEDDILVARTGATGQMVTNIHGVFHNNFFLFNYDRQVAERDYVYQYLLIPPVTNYLLLVAGTNTIPDLNHGAFYNTPILLPPKEEQQKIGEHIAETIKKNDIVIKKMLKEIELLKEYKTALISEVVTGKMDVRNIELN